LKYKGILSSSSDPSGQTLSKTIEGIIIGASSLIVFLFTSFIGIPILSADVVQLAPMFGTAIGTIIAIYGVIKKIVNRAGTE